MTDTLLERIATALEGIARSLEAGRPASSPAPAVLADARPPAPSAEPAPAASAAPAVDLTIEDVRRELIAATSAGTPAPVLLATLGAKRLSDVAVADWPKLVAAARAASGRGAA